MATELMSGTIDAVVLIWIKHLSTLTCWGDASITQFSLASASSVYCISCPLLSRVILSRFPYKHVGNWHLRLDSHPALSFPPNRKGRVSVKAKRERMMESRGQASGGGVWGRRQSPQRSKAG